jgi:DNA polymerase-3 subunit beta
MEVTMSNVTQQLISATLRQTNLRYLLDRTRGAVGRMHPYFRIDVYLTRLTCCATDLRVGAVSEMHLHKDEKVDTGGTVCIPSGKLWSIIDTLPDKPIILQGLDNNRLQIKCGTYSGVIACVDPDEHFPDMIIPGGAPDVECGGSFLNDIYAAIGHAIGANEESATSGLFLRSESGRLVGAATDGHRLSVAAISVPYDGECEPFNTGVTVSSRALGEIKKLACGSSEIRFRDNRMSIEQNGITIIARLFEKEFPAYRRIIPTKHPHCTVVNTSGLIEIIERVTILAESQGVTMEIRGGTITITGDNTAGAVLDSIDCETEGDDCDICITPRYLLDSLKSLKGSEDVIIKYLDAKTSVLLIPADHSNWDERIELIQPRSA